MTDVEQALPLDFQVSRREFLRYGGAGLLAAGVTHPAWTAHGPTATPPRSCLFLTLSGGPGPLETFDPKPAAPSHIRGPYRAIATAVPGLHVSELLPRLAERAGQVTFLRTLSSDAAPLHETGRQLLATGRLGTGAGPHPEIGALTAAAAGGPGAWFDLASGNRGAASSLAGDEAQAAALLDARTPGAPARTAEQYGTSRFGRRCLQAVRLIAAGARFVNVAMYDELAGRTTWDCHAQGPVAPTTLEDYARVVCPEFDRVFAALLDDLAAQGLLARTLVVAAGEFGRTPRINRHGGRDHWPACWSGLLAGGGLPGGRCLGASDAHAAAPLDRPIHPAELAATILAHVGVDPSPLAAAPLFA